MSARPDIAALAPEAPETDAIPAPTVWLLLIAYVGAVLLNVHHAAIWCAPVALAAAAWRARGTRSRPKMPLKAARVTIIIALTVGVLLSFRTLNGVAAGASLLVVMAALKLTETYRRRDWLIVVGASVFLLVAACLDAEALWRLPLYAAELWMLCAAMYALGGGARPPPLRELLRLSGRSLLVALPFALLLFIFVPRLPGSFWAVPRQDQAVTGLGDDMSPGSISRLIESTEPAMRVRFYGTLPPVAPRYWRGPVLHLFDGYTWRRGRGDHGAPPELAFSGPRYTYEVALEPNRPNVLIALDMPLGPPKSVPFAFSAFDYQLVVPQPTHERLSYEVQSSPMHRALGPLSADVRALDLVPSPPGFNRRSVALGQQMRARAADVPAFVASVLDYFRRGGFVYTLNPPKLDLNSVDDFLFNSREGFCGHYASAFVTLMRAGGVPAHVVTGYLGGVWNPFGEYLLIRQSDAHAWAEVWIDGRGWVRVDPTAVVAPGRLSRELDELLPDRTLGTRRLDQPAWLVDTVQLWQAANAWWQDQFVGFNFSRQLELLEHLGLGDRTLQALGVALAVGGGLWLAVVGWSLRPRAQRHIPDELGRIWRLLEHKLARAAGPRAAHEGPIAFAERIGRARPDLAATVGALARRYARLRYGAQADAEQIAQLRRAVVLLRLRIAHASQ